MCAARHGLPEVCITIINNMYGYNAMEVQEAFVKIKEQARAYLALPHDLRAGEPVHACRRAGDKHARPGARLQQQRTCAAAVLCCSLASCLHLSPHI